jgi:rhomboid family protein
VIPLKDNIPTRRFPVLTVLIIVACAFVYFGFEQGGLGLSSAGEDKVVEYGVVPYEITHPGKQCGKFLGTVQCEGREVQLQTPDGIVTRKVASEDLTDKSAPTLLTIFTSMFMHGGLLHIAGNMLFLWIFGNNVEDSMGRPRFVVFYLLGGIAAALAQVLVSPDATTPTIGASGAIAAVLGGYALLYPRARVVTLVIVIFFITLIELPALLVLGGWFLLQLFYGTADLTQPLAGGGGGVAYFAHIGGFVFGLVLIKLFANRVHGDYETHGRIPVY